MTIKDDLDTIFVAIDRLRVMGDVQLQDWHYATRRRDFNLANRALVSLANVRERLDNSVPAEQGKMEMGE